MENRIPFVAMGRVFYECARATGCPHFGMLVGQRINLAHLGMPGELMRYSVTLRAGLQIFVAFQHLNDQGIATFLSQGIETASLGCAVFRMGVKSVDQIYDAFLAMACSVMRSLWGSRWAPEEVLFSRARPDDVGAYRRYLRAPCRFDRERTVLVFPADLLDRPMPGADPQRLGRLEQQARAVGNGELVSRLRRALRILLLNGQSSWGQVAKLLPMHRRTLNRHLKVQGTTFQQVLDEIRFAAASQLLENTRIPLTEIAASRGYSESSAFSRAFRRWSGTPPSRQRSRYRADRLSA
jgi:AraC-like DNA-binding protein